MFEGIWKCQIILLNMKKNTWVQSWKVLACNQSKYNENLLFVKALATNVSQFAQHRNTTFIWSRLSVQETSWATMFPRQCVLVCHRLKYFSFYLFCIRLRLRHDIYHEYSLFLGDFNKSAYSYSSLLMEVDVSLLRLILKGSPIFFLRYSG